MARRHFHLDIAAACRAPMRRLPPYDVAAALRDMADVIFFRRRGGSARHGAA